MSDRPDREPGQSPEHVLLVSPDPLFSRIVAAKLETWGHPITEADYWQAEDLRRHEGLRLALIDAVPAEEQALRLCQSLRADHSAGALFILVFGPKDNEGALMRALEAGCDAFAVRPFRPDELKMRLAQAHRVLALADMVDPGAIHSSMIGERAFHDFLGVLFAQYRRSSGSGVIMFIEIDPALMRKLSPEAAVDIERSVADRVRHVHRASDFLAREGAGRYCLVLGNTTTLQAHAVALRLGDALAGLTAAYQGSAVKPPVTVSVLDFPAQFLTPAEALAFRPRTVIAAINTDA